MGLDEEIAKLEVEAEILTDEQETIQKRLAEISIEKKRLMDLREIKIG